MQRNISRSSEKLRNPIQVQRSRLISPLPDRHIHIHIIILYKYNKVHYQQSYRSNKWRRQYLVPATLLVYLTVSTLTGRGSCELMQRKISRSSEKLRNPIQVQRSRLISQHLGRHNHIRIIILDRYNKVSYQNPYCSNEWRCQQLLPATQLLLRSQCRP